MPALNLPWLAGARARAALARRREQRPPREDLVARLTAGRSFADVGCMWSVDGAICFAAEAAGAAAVTGIDVMPASEEFERERARRGSAVRFVQGDLHDPATLAAAGVHDVVWCSGVLYHAPHPLLTLERLAAIAGDTLILATEAIPELPGAAGGCVFYPGLREVQRRAWARLVPGHGRVGLDTPFDPAQGYGNWYWGITPSALRGMLHATGFSVVEEHVLPFHVTAVARRTGPPPAAPAAELEALVRRWGAAVRERDMAFLEGVLAPEFTLTTGRPTAPVRGREEYLAVTRERYEVLEHEFEDFAVTPLGPDAALVRSRYTQRGSMDGEDRSQPFLISDVLARRGGRWQAVSRHAIPLEPDAPYD